MPADALLTLAYDGSYGFTEMQRYILLCIVVVLSGLGWFWMAMFHRPRRDLASIVVTICAGSGLFVGAFGVAVMLLFWLYGSFDRQCIEILEQGLLLLATSVVLDKIWAPPPPSNAPPTIPPSA